jgi:hypothetical protein
MRQLETEVKIRYIKINNLHNQHLPEPFWLWASHHDQHWLSSVITRKTQQRHRATTNTASSGRPTSGISYKIWECDLFSTERLCTRTISSSSSAGELKGLQFFCSIFSLHSRVHQVLGATSTNANNWPPFDVRQKLFRSLRSSFHARLRTFRACPYRSARNYRGQAFSLWLTR